MHLQIMTWLRAALLAAVLMAAPAFAAQAQTEVTWYGQAAFKVVTPSGGVILIDPWLTVPTNPERNSSISELERVDYILLTHGHQDHVGDSVQIARQTGAALVAPYGLQINMKRVMDYPEEQATLATGGNVGGTIDLPKAGARVTMVHAVHASELTPGNNGAITSGNPVGYVLEIDRGPTLYHTGDTDVYSDMRMIPEFHSVDLMLACIGGHFTMGPRRAALAVKFVNPRQVVPMHFGTFPLQTGTPGAFKAALDTRGLGDRMLTMQPGETRTFER